MTIDSHDCDSDCTCPILLTWYFEAKQSMKTDPTAVSKENWQNPRLATSITRVFWGGYPHTVVSMSLWERKTHRKSNLLELSPTPILRLFIGKRQQRSKRIFAHCPGPSPAYRDCLKVMRRGTVNQVVTWKINSLHPSEESSLRPWRNGPENHTSVKSLES